SMPATSMRSITGCAAEAGPIVATIRVLWRGMGGGVSTGLRGRRRRRGAPVQRPPAHPRRASPAGARPVPIDAHAAGGARRKPGGRTRLMEPPAAPPPRRRARARGRGAGRAALLALAALACASLPPTRFEDTWRAPDLASVSFEKVVAVVPSASEAV